MGRGAHAAHAAYNGSGTQGLSVTDKINENEEIKSVFLTENDTTKQIIHGCNISEMTCSGKIESVNSERYKIFTPDENADMLGDIYLNFEMDSKITDLAFFDASAGTEIPLQNVTQAALSQSFSLAGEDFRSMNIDLSTRSLPSVPDDTSDDTPSHGVSRVNKILHVTYNSVNYEIVVGKGTYNVAIKSSASTVWSKYSFSYFDEINDIIHIPQAQWVSLGVSGGYSLSDNLIIGGKVSPTGNTPYKLVFFNNGALSLKSGGFTFPSYDSGDDLKIVTKIIAYDNTSILISGFKDHTDEVLRAPAEWFLKGAKVQTTIQIYDMRDEVASVADRGIVGGRRGVTFNVERDTASKRLESYNYKDSILSSVINYSDTDNVYIAGAKQKVLLGLGWGGEIKRSYDNGLIWESVNMYYGPSSATYDRGYYPLSSMYNKNETLVHDQLNKIAFMRNNLTASTPLKLSELKILIRNTFGYILNDIKFINRQMQMEYADTVSVLDIINTTSLAFVVDAMYNLSEYLDIRIKNMPVINDYEHIWVNIKNNSESTLQSLWPTGKNIRMTSKKFMANTVSRFVVGTPGSGYIVAPLVTVDKPVTAGSHRAIGKAILGVDGSIHSIIIVSSGTEYTGLESVTIEAAPTGGTTAAATIEIFPPNRVGTKYLTLAEFRQNIDAMIGTATDEFSGLTVKNVISTSTTLFNEGPTGETSVGEIVVASGGSGYTVAPLVRVQPNTGGIDAVGQGVIGSDGRIVEIDIISGGQGFDGTETAIIDAAPTGGTTAIIRAVEYVYSPYYEDVSVFELGFLQITKIDVDIISPPGTQRKTAMFSPQSIEFSGNVNSAINKPVDERLNDKLKIYMVIEKPVSFGGANYPGDTVGTLKNRLAIIYGGTAADYLIYDKTEKYSSTNSDASFPDVKVVYDDASAIINSAVVSNTLIKDTYADLNVEIRFGNGHPLHTISDPKIIYISIPLIPGTSGTVIQRRTVSVLANDLTNQVNYITIDQLKTKIKALLSENFYDYLNTGDYKLNLVSGGVFNGNHLVHDGNLYRLNVDDTKKINEDAYVPTFTGDILYLYSSYKDTGAYVIPHSYMNSKLNISLGTDPMYSEKIISKIGVMDDTKYYLPHVNSLVNNNKGLWVAAGPTDTASDIEFELSAYDSNNTLVEAALSRPKLFVFVSNNDGYDWHPVKFSIIEDVSTPRPKYNIATSTENIDPAFQVDIVAGYISNLQGDIRLAFNITSNALQTLEETAILDIDHYQICPDLLSANTINKAIKVSDLLVPIDPGVWPIPLHLATSMDNEYDIYSITSNVGKLIIQTNNSSIKYLYNNPNGQTLRVHMATDLEGFVGLAYKKLDSSIINLRKSNTLPNKYKFIRESSAGNKTRDILVGGQIEWTDTSLGDPEFETDSVNRAVLLTIDPDSKYNIFSYDNDSGNFIKVISFDNTAYSYVNFLENNWIITFAAANKYLQSYDTIHWREIADGATKTMKIYARNKRYDEPILIKDPNPRDLEFLGLKSKELVNTMDKYLGLSLFHDTRINGGIKVNVDEELIADRTNYIIETYTCFSKINTAQIYGANYGTLYEPNDIIKLGDNIIICGNKSVTDNYNTITLIETPLADYDINKDDIVFFGVRSLYTDFNLVNNKKDFISNFDMQRFYKDTNVSGDIVYCSGRYKMNDGTFCGILAVRSIPLEKERPSSIPNFPNNTYFWKLIYGPPSAADTGYDPAPDFKTSEPADISGWATKEGLLWRDTQFEKINDVVFADNKVVIVGKGKSSANLCYSNVSYPEWFGFPNPSYAETYIDLNFQEIHTVCFYKGHWFVGGRPIYEKDANNIYIRNDFCLAYTDDITDGRKWVYKSFPRMSSPTIYHGDSSIYEVNNMEIIDINGNTSILTNISYVAQNVSFSENLIMAVIFIDLDNLDNLSFSNLTVFDEPGILENSESGARTFNEFVLDPSGPFNSQNFEREKWLNRPFDLEINGVNRKIISSIHSPKSADMYFVDYDTSKGFILVSYINPNLPIIEKNPDSSEYPKFIKHLQLGVETLKNKTKGHCYHISKISGENFITGLNSARYVAVGKGVLSPISYSDDFEKWTFADAGNIFDIVFDVAHKHGIWIAIGEGNYNVGISKDGKSWTGVYSKWSSNNNLITTSYDTIFNSFSFSPDTKITDILPYIPEIKGIFLRNLSILRLFSRIEYHVGNQIWQTLTFDDIKAMLDTEFGAGEYANLLKNCSIINKDGSTKLTTWIPGFTKTLNSKLENFHNVSESGSFPSGLLKDQKLSIKIYYNKLENIIGNELTSSDMNNAVFDNFMNNTLIPFDRDRNYFIDSFLADNYGFQLGDTYKNVNGQFKLNFSTDIQRLRLYCKQFEIDDTEINEFNKGVKQVPKITQSLYFDADNTKNMLLDLDNFNMYASHIIVSGWLTSDICITDMNLELNGYSYNKTFEPSAIDFATKLCLGLNYNRYTFNGVDKEDGIGSLVIPLASTAYSGSSVPLDRYSSIRLRINFNANAGPRSYINVTCVGTTTVSYNNSTANIDIF